MNKTYLNTLRFLLDKLESTQESAIDAVSAACADAVAGGGLLYFFGTGHSHMICEEPFYRAGGLACVNPILEPSLMLHQGGAKSSALERVPQLGATVIAESGVGKGDVLFVVSNSGRNSAVIDAALEGKARGAVTVAITSVTHSSAVGSRHSSGKRLFEVCDYVLDNGGVLGDASFLAADGSMVGPTSTSVGAAILQAIVCRVKELSLEEGFEADFFKSSNVDGGDEWNDKLIAKYEDSIPGLN